MLSIIEERAIIIDLRFSNKHEMGEPPSLKLEKREPVRGEMKVPNTIDLPCGYTRMDFISVTNTIRTKL